MAYLHLVEAAELAIGVAKVGQAAYQLLARETHHPGLRALLEEMAQEEAAHCADWAALCDGCAHPPVRSEAEWQTYREYVCAGAGSVLAWPPSQLLTIAQQAQGERDMIGIAKALAERINRTVTTLCSAVSLDGTHGAAERILDDQASRLRDLERLLRSVPPECERPRPRQRGLQVALSAEERGLAPVAGLVGGG